MKTLYAEGNYINVNGELFPKTSSFSQSDDSYIISRVDNPQVSHEVLFSELVAGDWQDDLAVLWDEATLRAFLIANTGFNTASGGSDALSDILTAGNTTGVNDILIDSGQVITDSVTGSGWINLRNGGANNRVLIANDGGTYQLGGVELEVQSSTLFADGFQSYFQAKTSGLEIFAQSSNANSLTMGYDNEYQSFYNTSINKTSFPTGGNSVFINSGGSTMNANVLHSVFIGVNNAIGKTSNTTYLNQVGFHQSGTIEGLLSKATLTADRLWTLPNASGTVALTSDIPVAPTKFTSSGQTITSAGTVSVAHGLGAEPDIVQAYLQCVTAQAGYSIGDKISVDTILSNATTAASDNRGIAVVFNSTNLDVRFGSDTNVFRILNKTTGVAENLTNGNWNLYLKAIKI